LIDSPGQAQMGKSMLYLHEIRNIDIAAEIPWGQSASTTLLGRLRRVIKSLTKLESLHIEIIHPRITQLIEDPLSHTDSVRDFDTSGQECIQDLLQDILERQSLTRRTIRSWASDWPMTSAVHPNVSVVSITGNVNIRAPQITRSAMIGLPVRFLKPETAIHDGKIKELSSLSALPCGLSSIPWHIEL